MPVLKYFSAHIQTHSRVSVSPVDFLGVEVDEQINVQKQHANIKNTHGAEHKTDWNVFGNYSVKNIIKLYYASRLNTLKTCATF